MRDTDKRLVEGAARIRLIAANMRAANDRLEHSLGRLQMGTRVVEAVAPVDGAPELRVDGRVVRRFSTQLGVAAAEASARRTFERVAAEELTRVRTPKEMKRTVFFDGAAAAVVADACRFGDKSWDK